MYFSVFLKKRKYRIRKKNVSELLEERQEKKSRKIIQDSACNNFDSVNIWKHQQIDEEEISQSIDTSMPQESTQLFA